MSREALRTRSRSLKDICTTPEVSRVLNTTKSILASRALVCGMSLEQKFQACSDAARSAGCSNVLHCTSKAFASPKANRSPHPAKHSVIPAVWTLQHAWLTLA